MQIIQERLAKVTKLFHGSHEENGNGHVEACAMEAVAYIAGEPWSDHPECACPVIGAFMRTWNDSLPDAERTALILPLVPNLVGTRGSDDLANRRATMAADWLVRVHTPAWLRLAGLTEHADRLASLPEIIDFAKTPSLMPALEAARTAGAARRGDATAGDATAAAAADAARAAASVGTATAAAGEASWAAAWAASWAAAAAAARAGTDKELDATKKELQLSAVTLVERMIAEPDPIAKVA